MLFDGSPLLPSAVYADTDGRLLTGRDALHSARLAPARLEPNPKLRVNDGTEVRGISVLGYREDGTEQIFEQHLGAPDDTPGPDYDYFVVQKVSGFGPGNSTVMLCCGLSSLATALAVGLLASRWEQLATEFGSEDFALLYQFDNGRDIAVPSRQDVDVALDTVRRLWPRLPDSSPAPAGYRGSGASPRVA